MSPEVEALVVGLRRENPGWGPRTLLFGLEARGVVPLPGRSSVYRCLVRHGLIQPQARRRKRSDYRRWERSRAMELWQMDVVGGVLIPWPRCARTQGYHDGRAGLVVVELLDTSSQCRDTGGLVYDRQPIRRPTAIRMSLGIVS